MRTVIPAFAVLVLALALSSAGGTATPTPELVVSSNYRTLLYGDLFVVSADGTGRRNLTRSPYDDQYPSVDPTGRRIAFVSDRSGYRAVWVIGVDGTGLRRVTGQLPHDAFPNAPPVWDSTGRWLVFDAYSNASPSFTVWTVPAAGGKARRVGVGAGGVWSPTGLVAFVTVLPPDGRTRVKIVTRSGAARWSVPGRNPLWSPGGLLAVSHDGLPADIFDRPGHRLRTVPGSALAWSPRGELLAHGTRSTLWVTDRDGHELVVATKKYVAPSAVWWTPDGTTLSFLASGGTMAGRAWDVATHRVRTLGGAGPWSPDGRHYAYTTADGLTLRVGTPGQVGREVVSGPAGEPAWAGSNRLVYAYAHGGEQPATLHFAHATGGLDGSVGKPGKLWEAMAAWSPDGKSIAYSSGFAFCHSGRCQRYLDNDIWVRPASGSPSQRLTSTTSPGNSRQVDDAYPAWSPDGTAVAFTRTPYGGSLQPLATQVWVVPSAGGTAVRVAIRGGRPSWAPDAKTLAFRSDGVVALAGRDGSGFREIQSAKVRTDSDVAWSPDGSKLASIAPNGDVFTIDPTGSARRVVGKAGTGGPASVAWSPDGSRLAVSGAGIRVIVVATGRTTRLDAHVHATRPRWSPDGRKIAYSLDDLRTGAEEAYVVPAGGGRPVDIVPGPSQEDDPAWRPR